LAAPSRYRVVAALLVALALPVGAQAAKGAAPVHPPEWSQLSLDQQKILAPLETDWPSIEPSRRTKWLEIARRYPKMTPQQQARMQSQMKQWSSLTPQQRAEARERYKKIKDLPPEKREEIQRKWHEYNSLTEQEKHKLRQAHPGRSAKQNTRAFDLD
jgi:Protein of unknown function (DUF3106)